MSDFTTTVQDAYFELCIQARGVATGVRSRLSAQRGQTAAE